jgi:hypothetical protein
MQEGVGAHDEAQDQALEGVVVSTMLPHEWLLRIKRLLRMSYRKLTTSWWVKCVRVRA